MPCTAQELATLAQCYKCQAPDTLRAIKVLAIASEAATLGYTGVDATIQGLTQAAACLADCIDPRTVLAAEAAIAVAKANLAGAGMSTNVEVLANSVRALREQAGLDMLYQAFLCQINQHAVA